LASGDEQSENALPALPDGPVEERNEKEETKNDSDTDEYFKSIAWLLQIPACSQTSTSSIERDNLHTACVPLYKLFHCWKAFC